MTHRRHAELEAFLIGQLGRICYHGFLFHWVGYEVLHDPHVSYTMFADSERPGFTLGYSTFPKAILLHRFVVHAYPSTFAIDKLQETSFSQIFKKFLLY